MPKRLPDRVAPGLRVLFVGINPGSRSAELGHHYAGHSNRFWRLLHESGLVPEPLGFEDDVRLPGWGYGLTNLVARATPGSSDLTPDDYRAGRRTLLAKVRRLRPAVVALVGVTVYRAVFPEISRELRKEIRKEAKTILGAQTVELAGSPVFVLPNPSGRNAAYSYAEMLDAFRALRRDVERRSS